MWILLNNNGQVITTIPHGEEVRQGGSFSVYIAFDKSYFQNIIGEGSIIYSTDELLSYINGNIAATLTWDDPEIHQFPSAEFIKFEKIKLNESICMLEDKKNYIVYKFNGEAGYTNKFGNHNLILRLAKVSKDESGNVIEHEVYVSGQINIYVNPTYGFNKISAELSLEQLDLFLIEYQNKLFNLEKKIDSQKLNIKDEKVYYFSNIYTSFENFAEDVINYKETKNNINIYFSRINIDENISEVIALIDSNKNVSILTGDGRLLTFRDGIIRQIGGNVIVDTELNDTSVNPISNKAIKKYIDDTLRTLVYGEY